MNKVLIQLLARRRYLDTEYFDILARYAYCETYEVSLMQGELDSNKALTISINEKINDNMRAHLMNEIYVEALHVTGFIGRRKDKIDGNCLSVTNGKAYLVTDGCITDDRGRTLRLHIKPYAKANKCDYYFSDQSGSEGHSDFVILQEQDQ